MTRSAWPAANRTANRLPWLSIVMDSPREPAYQGIGAIHPGLNPLWEQGVGSSNLPIPTGERNPATPGHTAKTP